MDGRETSLRPLITLTNRGQIKKPCGYTARLSRFFSRLIHIFLPTHSVGNALKITAVAQLHGARRDGMEWITPFQASCNAAGGSQMRFSDLVRRMQYGTQGDMVGDLFDQQFSA